MKNLFDRSRKELFRAKETLLGILGFHSRDEIPVDEGKAIFLSSLRAQLVITQINSGHGQLVVNGGCT